jgi:hypothetical protein
MGIMGQTPLAGVAWQGLHYLEGLRRLGHDVYYVEDTGAWPYDLDANTITDDPTYLLRHLCSLMDRCEMRERWAYRSGARPDPFGLDEYALGRLWKDADVLVNLTGSTVLRDEHLQVPVRIYLETDPVLPQIEVALGHRFTVELLAAHTHLFTYAENLGSPDCGIPSIPFSYRATRQPVVLDWWAPVVGSTRPCAGRSEPLRFTTVANWRQSGKDAEWQGELYTWSKHVEFLKFLELPARTAARFELALACGEPEAVTRLQSHGWEVTDALALSRSIVAYRDYINCSGAEFTVAKDQNVRLRSGWFSDRSACYLAAGRPVITQDTGFGKFLPTGQGLFAFHNVDEAVEAVESVEADYEGQSRAALEVANEYFAAHRVLGALLDQAS